MRTDRASRWSVDGWLARMYGRHGVRYVRRGIAAAVVVAVLIVAPVCATLLAHYEGLSIGSYLAVVAIVGGYCLIAAAAVLPIERRESRPLLAWIAGERGERVDAAARRFAFDGPRHVVLRVTPFVVVGVPFALFVVASPTEHTSLLAIIEVSIGAELACGFGLLFAYFLLELGARPVRADLDEVAVWGAAPRGLAARVLVIAMGATYLAGTAGGYLLDTREAEGDGHLFEVYGIALAVTGLAALALAPFLAGTVVGPIRDLIRGTRAVADGDLDATVPVTSSDELGELASSFNSMVGDLRAQAVELRAAQARIVAASDAARRRVERDLHDGAQQNLMLLELKLGLLERRLRDDSEAAEVIADLRTDLDRALAELRDLAHGIYPAILTSDGLPGALGEAAEQSSIPVSVDCDGAGRYPPEIEAAVYFCCLEALQNAAKHAGEPARVRLSLVAEGDDLRFEVADDGAGFDPVGAAESGAGLQNMADRIGALGGALDVRSQRGVGTTVSGRLPVA